MTIARPLSLVGAASLAAASLFSAPEPEPTAVPFPSSAPPSTVDVSQAQATTAVLIDALLAAVVSISDATPPGSDPDVIEAGSKAVSTLVPGRWHSYRLIDATSDPLDHRNQPFGPFENQGLAQLQAGAPVVQQVVGQRLRTLVPLTSDAHPNCVTCHSNYAGLPPGTLVGAASLRVRL